MSFQPGDIVEVIQKNNESRLASIIKGYPNETGDYGPTHYWLEFMDNRKLATIYHHDLKLVLRGSK